jgi:hypothetical protein
MVKRMILPDWTEHTLQMQNKMRQWMRFWQMPCIKWNKCKPWYVLVPCTASPSLCMDVSLYSSGQENDYLACY